MELRVSFWRGYDIKWNNHRSLPDKMTFESRPERIERQRYASWEKSLLKDGPVQVQDPWDENMPVIL